MKVKVRSRETDARCAYCLSDVRGEWTCEGCGVQLHEDCANELGRCPTVGCRGRERPRPLPSLPPEAPTRAASPPVPARRARRSRVRRSLTEPRGPVRELPPELLTSAVTFFVLILFMGPLVFDLIEHQTQVIGRAQHWSPEARSDVPRLLGFFACVVVATVFGVSATSLGRALTDLGRSLRSWWREARGQRDV